MTRILALAVLALVAAILPASADESAIMRVQLSSPILFSGGDGSPDLGGNNGPATVSLASAFPSQATVNQAFSTEISIQGGTPPHVISQTGVLPSGISRNGNLVQGNFAAAGEFTFSFGVGSATTGPITVNVADPIVLTYTSGVVQLQRTVQGTIIAPVVSGGRGQKTFAVVGGSLPGSMALQPDGSITGTPSSVCAGCFVTVRATDQDGRVSADAVIEYEVVDPVVLTYASGSVSLQKYVQGTIAAPVVTGGRGQKTFAVVGGNLPASMTLQANGSITGVPSSVCVACWVSIRATDQDGRVSADAVINYTVNGGTGYAVYVGKSAAATAINVATASVSLPPSVIKDDLLLLVVETANQAVATPSGWVQVSYADNGAAAGSGSATRVTLFRRWASDSEVNAQITNAGDHTYATMFAFRGVNKTQPFAETVARQWQTPSMYGTTTLFPSTTADAQKTIVFMMAARADEWTDNYTSVQMPATGYLNYQSVFDSYTTVGEGGALSVSYAESALSGTVGQVNVQTKYVSYGAALKVRLRPE